MRLSAQAGVDIAKLNLDYTTVTAPFDSRDPAQPLVLGFAPYHCRRATQVLFWMFTYPINVATDNWTVAPEAFEAARRQWEYSHAVNAVLTFVAFVAIILSVLSHKGDDAGSRLAD